MTDKKLSAPHDATTKAAAPDTNRRNLLRRRTKEAYRLQKQLLTNHCGQSNVDLALIYSSKEVLPYKTIAHAVRRILENVAERL